MFFAIFGGWISIPFMPDFAVLVNPATFHSSLGAMLDAFTLVRDQVESRFGAEQSPKMQTQLRLMTADGKDAVMADGRSLTVQEAMGGTEQFALVHMPSFLTKGFEPLAQRLLASTPVYRWLARQRAGGAVISASGSAIFLLAQAGLLDGSPIPLTRALIPLCRRHFPKLRVDEARVVVEQEGIILGAGLASDQALMARVIERTISADMGNWITSVMGIDRVVDEKLSGDLMVASAQLWLEQQFAQDVKITDLAKAMACSHHTLIRRFERELGMSPKAYMQQLRVQAAQLMLRRTRRTVEQISLLVGYRDVRSFRSVFQTRLGISPTAYRRNPALAPAVGSSVSKRS